MALGDDSALSPSLREAFRTSGLSHLLAASGQNVALLCALALALGAALGLRRRARLVLALVLTGLYVPLAGGGPSILRAGAMGGATLIAALAGRPASRVYALLVAAALTLGCDPRATTDPGWQLSFAAVLAIAAFARPWSQRLRGRGLPPSIAEAAALTAAATVGTAPLIMFHFGRLSLVSLPANVLAAPAVVPVVWIATLAGVAGQVSAAAGGALAGLASVPLAYLDWLARAAARVPSAELPLRLGSPLALLAVYAGLTALALNRRLRIPALVLGVPLLAAMLATARPPPPPDPNTLIVSFLDVGQGDATLLQHRGLSVLVDTGPPVAPVLDRLREEGVRRLDLLVVTHAEADHDGNAVTILGALPVGLILDGGSYSPTRPSHIALRTAARRRGVRLLAPAKGQVLRLGPLELDVLWPDPTLAPGALKAGANRNDHAVVLHVRDGTFDLLLPADAESNVTSHLDLPHVEAFKVSHHGSKDPGLAGILARLRPQVAVIEVGAINPYGHPTRQALADLKAGGALLRRTDQDGTVRLLVRPSGMEVATTK
jgi:competence protein ComEC